MTPADLQNQMMKRLGEILKDFPLQTGFNDLTPFKIFKQNTPERLIDELDYTDRKSAEEKAESEIYPFVVVRLSNGKKDENHGTQDNSIQLIIGVKNESLGGEGFDDALAVMEAILGDFNQNPIIDKRFVLQYPTSWSTTDENTYPYYFIGIETVWESMTLTNQGGHYNV